MEYLLVRLIQKVSELFAGSGEYVGFGDSLFPWLVLFAGLLSFGVAGIIFWLSSIGDNYNQGTLGVIIFIVLGLFLCYQSFHITW